MDSASCAYLCMDNGKPAAEYRSATVRAGGVPQECPARKVRNWERSGTRRDVVVGAVKDGNAEVGSGSGQRSCRLLEFDAQGSCLLALGVGQGER